MSIRSRLGVISLGCLLIAPAVAFSQSPPALPVFTYDYLGETMEMHPSQRFVAVRLIESAGPTLSQPYPYGIRTQDELRLGVSRLTVLPLEPDTSAQQVAAMRANLRQMTEVELVAWVFESPSGLTIATDEFLVRFADDVAESQIEELNLDHRAVTVRRLPASPNTWILRSRDGDAFAGANRFHALGSVDYAHPDFVHVREDGLRPPTALETGGYLLSDGRFVPASPSGSVPADAVAAQMPATLELPKAVFGSDLPGAPTPDAATDIKTENFEGAFPNSWSISGDPHWDAQSYRVFDGSWGGYCAASSVAPPGPYPDGMGTWMIYGPFSLIGAVDARMSFWAWIRTYWDGADVHDDLFYGYSTDGHNFYGWSRWGNWTGNTATGWRHFEADLAPYVLGESQVWLAIVFASDSDGNTEEGVYIDNVAIQKQTTSPASLTNDVYDDLQWHLNNSGQNWGTVGADIRADEAWAVTHGSTAVKIAVLDTGVDLTHPDLTDKLLAGYDATGGGSSGGPSGDDAHGTNCAGVAAAATDNMAGVAGLAWDPKILPIRIGTEVPTVIQYSWVVAGINWAVTNGADVLSNSYSLDTPTTAVTNAIRNATQTGRGGKGSVVLVATGNSNGPVAYPANLPQTLAIGASSQCDERKSHTSCDGEAWGSNYGAQLDLLAPGVEMYTTDIQGAAGYSSSDYFDRFNGTSSATPLTAGAAALVLSQSPTLTGAEAVCHLRASAVDLGPPGWDNEHGFGRLDTHGALTTTIQTQRTVTGDQSGTQSLTACDMVVGENATFLSGSDTTLLVTGSIEFRDNVVVQSSASLSAGRGSY